GAEYPDVHRATREAERDAAVQLQADAGVTERQGLVDLGDGAAGERRACRNERLHLCRRGARPQHEKEHQSDERISHEQSSHCTDWRIAKLPRRSEAVLWGTTAGSAA